MFRADKDKVKELEEGGKYEWKNDRLSKDYYDGRTTYTSISSPYLFKCLKCGTQHTIGECSNCGSRSRKVGESNERLGIFCESCERGFTEWTCLECGTKNPASRTLYYLHKIKGCFIATAVYGSPLVNEVLILKTLRDKVIARSQLGRVFITCYYRFSPFYARLISQSETLKKVVRATTIDPLVRLVRSFLKRK